MKRYFCLILLLICLHAGFTYAQNRPLTVILLRHAEKQDDGSKDPPLSIKGQEFSQKLADILKETKVNAIYSTAYKRTTETVMPLAKRNKLSISNYDPGKPKELLEKIRKSGDQIVVVAGHSNTIQMVFNLLITETQMEALSDDEFRKVFIIYRDFKEPLNSRYVKLDLN